MKMVYDEDKGCFLYGEEIPEGSNKYFTEAFIRYFNIFYMIFNAAFEKNGFDSLLTMFGVRGIEDAGWDAYESSQSIINSIIDNNESVKDYIAQKTLHLWLYGHIVEASEPYEKIANLLDIIDGESYSMMKFPPRTSGTPISPGEKIKKICDKARVLGFDELENLYGEFWNRDLRNSIFHSDYSLYGTELRLRRPLKVYTQDNINEIVNYSIAYFKVIGSIKDCFIQRYTESKVINTPEGFKTSKNEKAKVIVRKGYGAIGIKDNWTIKELNAGAIPYRIGRFYPEDSKMLDEDRMLSIIDVII